MLTAIRQAAAVHGVQAIARKARVSRQHLHEVLMGRKVPQDARLAKLAKVAQSLGAGQPTAEGMLPAVRECCGKLGRRHFARLAGINDGHLGRILAGTRRPAAATLAKLARALEACKANAAADTNAPAPDRPTT